MSPADHTGLAAVPDEPAAEATTVWKRQWDLVPDQWRSGRYLVDAEPWSQFFVQNAGYTGHIFDLRVTGHNRATRELVWWMHCCWAEGLRKVEPSTLRWYARALASVMDRNAVITGHPVTSILEVGQAQIVRELTRVVRHHHRRVPSPDMRRHVADIAESVELLLAVRCSENPWWDSDIWDLTIDGRIPRRAHEPAGNTALRLVPIEPAWLRDGVRFWLSHHLTYDVLTWTSCLHRARLMAAHISRFVTDHGLATPLLVDDVSLLRPLMMRFVSWLRSPAAIPAKTGKPLSATTISKTQSCLQAFYTFMLDHADEAAEFTSEPRWRRLTADYVRLWPPEFRLPERRSVRSPDQTWMSTTDMQQMVCCLPILAADKNEEVTVTLPGGRTITHHGLGDPQAMRAWLLQAMTGRRASEILLLDFDPIRTLNRPPGPPAVGRLTAPETGDDADQTAPESDAGPEAGTSQPGEPDVFVARLRYQQTKIAGVDPTILVEQAVVDLIHEQQQWVTEQLGREPDYLFVVTRQNHQGIRPRNYQSHSEAMRRLDLIVDLVDGNNKPLQFTKTHRLRHTRATELLNNNVPLHVVQRYFGHLTPTMVMRYAATLSEVAEAEFLRYTKIGADARDLDLDPKDLYEKAQLDRRTDRILPTGYCLLPPTQSCDRGNACLSCSHYATDRTHLTALQDQREQTVSLIEQRQAAFTARHGTPMGPDHIWLAQRSKEIAALNMIIERLTDEEGNLSEDSIAVRGAGVGGRRLLPLTPVTDGAHDTALRRG